MRPPGVAESWDEIGPWHQAMLIAFDQISDHDEMKTQAILAGLKVSS